MKRAAITALVALCGSVPTSAPAAAQRLVDDWLVRTGAGPTALEAGPTAAFWNPAGVRERQRGGSAVVLQLLAPEATGVNVVAAAGAWGLDEQTSVAVGFQHFSIDDVSFTVDDPVGTRTMDIAQDLFTASASRRLGTRLRLGGTAQYLRSSSELDSECTPALDGEDGEIGCRALDELSIGLGARYDAPLPLPVTFGAFALSQADRILWGAGVQVEPDLPLGGWNAGLRLGAAGGRAGSGLTYSGAVTGAWRSAIILEAGLVAEPDALERQWEPELAATVRLHRYEIGVVREWLPNSFGSVNTFRFGVSF